MFDKIKQLAAQCDIHELDGYMASLHNDQDGLMRISAEQFNKFCNLLLENIQEEK